MGQDFEAISWRITLLLWHDLSANLRCYMRNVFQKFANENFKLKYTRLGKLESYLPELFIQ